MPIGPVTSGRDVPWVTEGGKPRPLTSFLTGLAHHELEYVVQFRAIDRNFVVHHALLSMPMSITRLGSDNALQTPSSPWPMPSRLTHTRAMSNGESSWPHWKGTTQIYLQQTSPHLDSKEHTRHPPIMQHHPYPKEPLHPPRPTQHIRKDREQNL